MPGILIEAEFAESYGNARWSEPAHPHKCPQKSKKWLLKGLAFVLQSY